MTDKTPPQPVQTALTVLTEIRNDMPAERFDALRGLLPGYAMALSKSGMEPTAGALKAVASQGADAVKSAMQALKRDAGPQRKSYEDIILDLRIKHGRHLPTLAREGAVERIKEIETEPGMIDIPERLEAIREAVAAGQDAVLAHLCIDLQFFISECSEHFDWRAPYQPGNAHAVLITVLAETHVNKPKAGRPHDETIRALADDMLAMLEKPRERLSPQYEDAFLDTLKAVGKKKLLKEHGEFLAQGAAKEGYAGALAWLGENGVDIAVALSYKDIIEGVCDTGSPEALELYMRNGGAFGAEFSAEDAVYQCMVSGRADNAAKLVEHMPELAHSRKFIDGFETAASNGHVDVLKYAVENHAGVITQEVMDKAVDWADDMEETDAWRYLLSRGAKPKPEISGMLIAAARENDIDMLKEVIASGVRPDASNGQALCVAAEHGHYGIAEYLLDMGVSPSSQGTNRTNDSGQALANASKGGHYEIAKLLLERGANPNEQFGNAFMDACLAEHTDIMRLLADHGAHVSVQGCDNINFSARRGLMKTVEALQQEHGIDYLGVDHALRCAREYGDLVYLHHYYEKGAFDPAVIEPDDLAGFYRARLDNITKWKRAFGENPPKGLEGWDPTGVRPKVFNFVRDIMAKEDNAHEAGNKYAYAAALLFGSEDRVMQYFEKWGAPTKQPLHDVIRRITLPTGQSVIENPPTQHDPVLIRQPRRRHIFSTDFDIKAWADATLQHGPEMAKLVGYAGRIPQPLRSDDGKSYSLNKTRDKAAEFSYRRGAEFPELARLCLKYSWGEREFDMGAHLLKTYRHQYAANDNAKPDNIPDITLDGKKFGMPGYKFARLPDGDLRGLFLGELTDCCQHLAEAGAACAQHGFLSEHGGFYVVTNDDDEIVGQSWAWRGSKDELVLDSLETLGGRVSRKSWGRLCTAFARAVEKKRPDVSGVYVGASGATPKLEFEELSAEMTALPSPRDYNSYRDSRKRQYRVWQRPGA